MAGYNDVFGGDTIAPAGKSYRLIPLTSHVTLNWPFNYEGDDFIADINNVTGSAANWHITLPAADTVSPGQDFLVRNVGLYAFQLDSASSTPIATLQPGDVKYVYLMDNATAGGTWGVVTFGAATSTADAASLAGSGLTVIGSRLAAAHNVYPLAANVSATTDDRSKIFAFNGGSNTLTLKTALELTDGWFIGVRNAGTGTITIACSGVDRVDDQTSIFLSPGESLFVFCNGATFYTVGHGRSTQFQFTKLVKDVSTGGSFTLTSGEASNKLLQFTGNPASNVTVTVPAITSVYYVQNNYTGSASLTLKTPSGSGVTMSANENAILFCDGVDVEAAMPTSGGGGGGGGGGGTFSGVFSDGTVTSPSITFTADNNLGFWRIANDVIGLAVGGIELARWGTFGGSVIGNFGIGTTSPQGSLDVRGLSVFSGGTVLSGSLPTGTFVQVGSANALDTRVMVDSYGAPAGPYVTLRQSRGTASTPTASQSGNNLGSFTFRGRGSTTWSGDRGYMIGRATENWTDTAQGAALLWAVTPNGSVIPAVKMVLDSNGWLCVNNDANPVAPLDVNGDARFLGEVETGGLASSKADIPLSIENTATHALINMQAMGATRGYVCADSTYCFKMVDSSGTNERFRVANNTSGVHAYAYNTISDERLKEDWEPLPKDFIERLAAVKSGTYRLKEGGDRLVGVGAQSFQSALLEAVQEDPEGVLSVSYGNAALASVIELAKEVIALRQIVMEQIHINKG